MKEKDIKVEKLENKEELFDTDKIEFKGRTSAIFDRLEKGDYEALKHLEIIEDYGSHAEWEDGSLHPLFQWDEGGRKLARYDEDASLFLVQTSVVMNFENDDEERDWYQVESKEQADYINKHLDGQALSYHYKGPKVWTADGKVLFKK